jgi:hypothetical protein
VSAAAATPGPAKAMAPPPSGRSAKGYHELVASTHSCRHIRYTTSYRGKRLYVDWRTMLPGNS